LGSVVESADRRAAGCHQSHHAHRRFGRVDREVAVVVGGDRGTQSGAGRTVRLHRISGHGRAGRSRAADYLRWATKCGGAGQRVSNGGRGWVRNRPGRVRAAAWRTSAT